MHKYLLIIFTCLIITGCLSAPKNTGDVTVSQYGDEADICAKFNGAPSTEEEGLSIEENEKKCFDSEFGFSTLGMLQCQYDTIDAWNRLINKNYCALKDILSTEEKIRLEENHKKWLENLEIEKKEIGEEAYKEHEGGSIWKLAAASKTVSLYETRSHELKQHYLKIR